MKKVTLAVYRAHRGLPVGFLLLRYSIYLLLSPYLRFISFLYLDLCVLGYDALISWGFYMQAGYLCVLVRVWIGGGVGAVKPV